MDCSMLSSDNAGYRQSGVLMQKTNPCFTLPQPGLDTSVEDANRVPSCLVRIHPAGLSGSHIPLGREAVTFGRSHESSIEISDDFISRNHATIEVRGADYLLRDLGSMNGTFVNDLRIVEKRLAPGDQIRIGTHIFKFLSADDVEAQYHEAVYQMMTTDGLTGAYNRRYFQENLSREMLRAQRHWRPIGLMLFDIDHFKNVNDSYGHVVGDEVLRGLCRRVKSRVRADELFARLGGEEFGIALMEISSEKLVIVAEEVRSLVASQPFDTIAGSVRITISLGLGHTTGQEPLTIDELFQRADEKLYEAKRGGRNQYRI